MRKTEIILAVIMMAVFLPNAFPRSPSFDTFVNPVIPGDHPDPTLTKVWNHFYTSGSSFNPTPKIYHSTDLVHWEVISQPVSASWSEYGDEPGGGIWGGHLIRYNDQYWHFFGRGGGSMYFVTAEQPEGPWSSPTRVQVPQELSGLGVDNSIFIDDDYNTWYLLVKHGRENNHIVELNDEGQPTGKVLDLTWLNPDSEGNPYGWAEGPVMWKYNGYYYYSFAQHLAGAQYAMRSDTLSQDESDWKILQRGSDIFSGTPDEFNRPNHISPAVMLDDGTSWVISHAYYQGIGSDWMAHGRQGLLSQLQYDVNGDPNIDFPSSKAVSTPDLPSSGIPWMVPKSDMFRTTTLNPEWSFLGYTPDNSWSLTDRPGWLTLTPYRGETTVVKNDGEHNYSLITRVDFEPNTSSENAGLRIINGPENLKAKVYTSLDSTGPVLGFSFNSTVYEVENTIGSVVWLRLIRHGHTISGYYSAGGDQWTQIGEPINAVELDREQTQFNDFTGNQQGLYVRGREEAVFDLYIYRDAYSPVEAEYPANKTGVARDGNVLRYIHSGDWAMYAGVEFGSSVYPEFGTDYHRAPDSLYISATVATGGGVVEVWLDSIDTGRKIAECGIPEPEGPQVSDTFRTEVDTVSGRHDLYLKFRGSAAEEELFWLNNFEFTSGVIPVSVEEPTANDGIPGQFSMDQNYPNPFNPTTEIAYSIPKKSRVTLTVYNLRGEVVRELVDGVKDPGEYLVTLNAGEFASGIYLYQLKSDNITLTKKCIVVK
ncbi:MAG: family 43 glycosylhydrolase [Candidatus Marinimicrobia bacterium]|nr:family 43 glycosylhydrolase [Candidatus Neomarinimicrobiota bacterium]MCF7880611.1 family 43 glycosylhydrolase [Candidatus Neomarinimicrobiota bacterium]